MKTIKIYEYHELSEEAKERAREDYRESINERDSEWITGEVFDSLKATCVFAGFGLEDWNIGEDSDHLRLDIPEDIENIEGPRAFSWLENNLIGPLRAPWKWTAGRKKYGERPGMIKSCPFTGVCYDEDMLESLRESIARGRSIKDSFIGLGHTAMNIIRAEMEYRRTDEAVAESIEANEYHFFENGKIYA
jgi:hypothetical protein